jgi:hypothetical protein
VPKIDKEGAATIYIHECRRREPASVDKEQESWAVLYVTSRPVTTPRQVTTPHHNACLERRENPHRRP